MATAAAQKEKEVSSNPFGRLAILALIAQE
jgi:hypothetical protein